MQILETIACHILACTEICKILCYQLTPLINFYIWCHLDECLYFLNICVTDLRSSSYSILDRLVVILILSINVLSRGNIARSMKMRPV